MVIEMTPFRICGQRLASARKLFGKFGFRLVLFLAVASFSVVSKSFAENLPAAPVQLASFSGLIPLPDASMAVITGTGLQSPSFTASAQPRGAVTLWDEARPPNLQQRLDHSGSVNITVNGVVQ
jgi:hypothetical protein